MLKIRIWRRNRCRYSRERAPRSLGENYSILFIRVLTRATFGCWRRAASASRSGVFTQVKIFCIEKKCSVGSTEDAAVRNSSAICMLGENIDSKPVDHTRIDALRGLRLESIVQATAWAAASITALEPARSLLSASLSSFSLC